jgi:hypothetical protein
MTHFSFLLLFWGYETKFEVMRQSLSLEFRILRFWTKFEVRNQNFEVMRQALRLWTKIEVRIKNFEVMVQNWDKLILKSQNFLNTPKQSNQSHQQLHKCSALPSQTAFSSNMSKISSFSFPKMSIYHES